MLKRSIAMTIIAVLSPALLWAQCTDWLAGPMDNGTLPNGADGNVNASMVWDPPGSVSSQLVVAGNFTTIQGVAANYIAALNPTTGQWEPLGSGTNGVVHALYPYNGELIVAGNFTDAGGASANYVARWNGSSWLPLDHGVNPNGVNAPVYALSVYGGAVILGGAFSQAGALPAARVTSWTDAGGFQSLGVGVGCLNGQCSGQVNTMAQWNGELVVAGSIQYAGNNPARYIARWNGSSWLTLPGGELNGEVTSLQPYTGGLVIGGRFTQVHLNPGAINVNHITSWTGASFATLGTGTVGDVTSLGYFNGYLVVGGISTGGGIPVNGIALWNGASSAWSAMGTGLTTTLGGAAGSSTCFPFAGELIVGGYFNRAGGQIANNLARWDGSQWSAFGGGTAATVFEMTNYVGRLIVAGSFHQYAGVGPAAHNILGWDGVRMYAYGSGMNNTVISLKAHKYPGVLGANELIAGGLFTTAGGVSANFIARWSQSPFIGGPPLNWEAMGPGFNSAVYAIERYNSNTYAGGPFTVSGATSVNRIARWNETTDLWEAVGTGMNGAVRALKEYNGILYAGGDFTTAGGVSTGGLARWNGSSWSAVSGVFSGQVHTLEVWNGLLVIGGQFPGVGGSANVVYYNGSAIGPLGGTNGRVQILWSTGTQLFMGGEFSQASGATAGRIAKWGGTAWEEVDGGATDIVLALRSFNGEVHAGGLFTAVRGGTLASPCWAKVPETGAPWIAYQPFSVTVEPGQNAEFTATVAEGYSDLTFQWYRFGVPLSDGPTGTGSTIIGATSEHLTVANVSHFDYGEYQMIVTGLCGEDTSFVATLHLAPGSADVMPGAVTRTLFEAIGPNPTGGTSRLSFALAHEAEVRVEIRDVTGRRVRRIDVGTLPAGRHQAAWDVRSDGGERVRPGIYFVSLEADGRDLGVKRLTVLR